MFELNNILKNEINLANEFNMTVLYNYNRGCNEFYKQLLFTIMQQKFITTKAYYIDDYYDFINFYDKYKFSNKKNNNIFCSLNKYSREPESDIMKLVYIYFKLDDTEIETNKEMVCPLKVDNSNRVKASIINKRENFIIINSNENAEDFIKLCLIKDCDLYVVIKSIYGDKNGLFLHKIIKPDNFLGVMESLIVQEKEEELKRMKDIFNKSSFFNFKF